MRTVQQKRVYGKRKTNAPRAVLDHGSPLKSTSAESLVTEKTEIEDIVQRIEVQVARFKLTDEQIQQEEPHSAQSTTTASPARTICKVSTETLACVKSRPAPEHPSLRTPQHRTSIKSSLKQYSGEKRLSFTPRAPRPKPSQKSKPIQRLSSGCVEDDRTNQYAQRILDEAESQIASRGVQKFSSWAARSECAFDPVKIAEGSYGEVYKLRLKEELCKRNMSKSRLAKLRDYGEGVFKIVPLRAQKGLGSKKFTTIDEIVAEVKLLKLLDPIPGFARFREVHVVQGRFPPSFQRAWDSYKAEGKDCQNPNPANKRAYSEQQLWAILEMDDAGIELEQFKWSSVFQVYDIFWGVAMGLARAEEYALFEHRDLHLGNVCLRSNRVDGNMHMLAPVGLDRLTSTSGFGISSLETTIIDYSLSRAELRLTGEPDEEAEVASTDLDSKGLFDAVGRDENEALQRDTYRFMRAQLYTGIPLTDEKPPVQPGIWAEYAPRTNLIWLLFILKMLVKQLENTDFMAQDNRPTAQNRLPLQPCTAKANRQQQNPIEVTTETPSQKFKHKIVESVTNSSQSDGLPEALQKLQPILHDRLSKVLDILDLEHGRDDMCCAADLVAYAIDQRWLDERDFFLA